jgi:uncharacterized membrane protein
MSGATYVEFFQQLDRKIAVPIAITGVGGTLLAGVSAFAHYSNRTAFYLLLAAFGLGLVGSAVTVLVSVPINEQLATWNPTALPLGYEEVLRRWWEWHHVRLATMFAAMCLVFGTLLTRR